MCTWRTSGSVSNGAKRASVAATPDSERVFFSVGCRTVSPVFPDVGVRPVTKSSSKTQPFAFQGDLSATAGPRKRIGSAKLKPTSTETLDRVSPPPHRVVRRQPTIGDAHDGREDGGKRVLGSSRARGVVGSVPGLAAVGDRCPACDGELRKLTIIFPVRCVHERFGVRLLPAACAVLRQSYIPTQCRSKRRRYVAARASACRAVYCIDVLRPKTI